MKKGKSRNKRKKTRSRLLWIAIAVIGIAAVISAVCVAGMLATKENAWKTPEELLVEYMDHIPKQEYEEMYAMLHIEASGNVSQEDFVTRNSAIYEGIEVQNIAVQIIAYDEEQMTVTYQTSFDTVAGTISFENKALFLKDEEGYQLVWDDSLIFPNLASTDKVRVSTTQAERGEILDRNGRVLAGKGTASSVGIVPGKLENREEAIAQIAELLEITPEAIEKKLSAKDAKAIIERIGELQLEDGVNFRITSVKEIMEEFDYPGIRMMIEANLERMRQPFKIDISTDDAITPGAVEYKYKLMFEDRSISVLSYNLETLLAEKMQTILARGLANTRMRDFYDVYEIMNSKADQISFDVLKKAFAATCMKRETSFGEEEMRETLDKIKNDFGLDEMWNHFKRVNYFVDDLSWGEVSETIVDNIEKISFF